MKLNYNMLYNNRIYHLMENIRFAFRNLVWFQAVYILSKADTGRCGD